MREISFDEFCASIGTTKQISIDLFMKHHDPNYHKAKDIDGRIIHHHFIFCAIASSNMYIKSIFEIGTCAGNCARLLANIFPESVIKTLDVPENKDRDNAVKLLSPLKNVEMVEYNSVFLWKNEKEAYDCVFVDGCHEYPVVFSDMMWAYFNAGKIIVFHDVGPGAPHVVESLKYLDLVADEEVFVVDSGNSLVANVGILGRK